LESTDIAVYGKAIIKIIVIQNCWLYIPTEINKLIPAGQHSIPGDGVANMVRLT